MTYLDHAATTAPLPEAVEAFAREAGRLGNPSSLHAAGRAARASLETSRERIAAALGAEPTEVVLTSGGCEADTLAVVGGFLAAREADPARDVVALSAIEHPAVRDAADGLASRHGARRRVLPVTGDGVLDLDALAGLLAAEADGLAVVSVMAANNETGVVQPVEDVVRLVREAAGTRVLVHSDAVQALASAPVDFAASDLDALSLSGHKLGAPVGIGALLAQRTTPLARVQHGGGQERGVRSGTVPVALAAALAVAVEHAVASRVAEGARLAALREELEAEVRARIPDVRVSGAAVPRLPGFTHLVLPGADVDALLFLLDAAGVQASAGSACEAGVTQPSEVMLAMGEDERTARSVLRLTLGRTTTRDDVAELLAVLPEAVERARVVGRGR
ncbi:cysteine desulfurase [Salana multivorans]|uniref:cysteine desulfurase n=1 Tax=Salana multivorans TaxID=120377 RepID=A0A3N2D841_9MICO|nr:cysteine desulfurase family protein [Salana multivorans]OJX98238.1 MAG: cysteine desulfurase NifS [Micrococcales bacterium 73-15]ROR95624.1 cysteine desulfurase [Salana multivorans]